MLKSDITKIFTNFNSHTDDYLGAMYINIYNELPQCYRVYYLDNKELHYQHSSESFYDIRKNQKYKVDCRKLLQNLKDKQDELGVEVFCYSPHEFLDIVIDFNVQISSLYHFGSFFLCLK